MMVTFQFVHFILMSFFALFHQMPESDAFELFRYVLFDLGIRSQYKPDMTAVQVFDHWP